MPTFKGINSESIKICRVSYYISSKPQTYAKHWDHNGGRGNTNMLYTQYWWPCKLIQRGEIRSPVLVKETTSSFCLTGETNTLARTVLQ